MLKKPLDGIKVVEFGTVVAGPTVSKALLDWGADVIKVEQKGGDFWRVIGTHMTCTATDEENPIFDIENGGKKTVCIDVYSEEGLKLLKDLIGTADVFVTNMRQKALENMKLTYEDIKDEFPGLIYGHMQGYGAKGPMKDTASYDITAFWTRSGLVNKLRYEDGEPMVPGISSFGDHAAAIYLAGGICAALYRHAKTGEGEKVEASLFGAGVFGLGTMITATQYNYSQLIASLPKNSATNAVYQCSDDEWVLITVPDVSKYFKNMCECIERPDLLDNPQFNTMAALFSPKGQELFYAEFQNEVRKHPSDYWIQRLAEFSLPAEKVCSWEEVAVDEQALVNNYLKPVTYPSGKTVNIPMIPVNFVESEDIEYAPSRPIGQDTVDVLKEYLNLSDDEIKRLVEEEIVIQKA